MATSKPISHAWTWRQILKRAAEVFREEDIKSLWFKILGETVYRRLVLMERPLNEPVPEVTPRLPVAIGPLREFELDDYIEFRPEADPPEVRRRLEAGDLCFVARHEGRIVNAGWATTCRAWIEYLACEMRLAPGEVYHYESFTTPSFRGLNISPARYTQMLRYLRDAGYRRSVSAVVPENKAGISHLKKVGYRPFGVMGYVKLGPWRRDFCWVDPALRPPGESPAISGSMD